MADRRLSPRAHRPGVQNWGQLRELAGGPGIGVSLARMTVRPGATTPAHYHANCSEVVYVERGAVELARAGVWTLVAEGATETVAQGEIHQLRNPFREDAVPTIAWSTGERRYREV